VTSLVENAAQTRCVFGTAIQREAWLRQQQQSGWRLKGRLFAPVPGTSTQSQLERLHHLQRSPTIASVPAAGRTQHRAKHRRNRWHSVRGSNRRELPLTILISQGK
jgi:hypothetical protein